MSRIATPYLTSTGDELPTQYDRAPEYEGFLEERDIKVRMRDGVHLSVDVFRPDTKEKLPALLAFAIYNKDLQAPDIADALTPQPSWASMWTGWLEAGDTRFLTSRGYIHVISAPRGIGKAEGGGSREFDSYDLIEWIAKQPWCDGQVGMIGISGFGAEQFNAAKQQPPALKAIFPFDPRGAYGTLGSFREEYHGGFFISSVIFSRSIWLRIRTRGSPATCRRTATPCGATRWPIRTSRSTRMFTIS